VNAKGGARGKKGRCTINNTVGVVFFCSVDIMLFSVKGFQ